MIVNSLGLKNNFDNHGVTVNLWLCNRHNSCTTSSGQDLLKLCWAKANTSASWPSGAWTGNVQINGVTIGDNLGSTSIPPLEPGEHAILEVPWNNMPNPNDFEEIDMDAPWHFCIRAHIVSQDDPIAFPGTWYWGQNNNNIASKNVHIDDDLQNKTGGTVFVGNFFEETKSYTLEFTIPEEETGQPVYEEAEVSIEMNDVLYNAWIRGGGQSANFRETSHERVKIITGNHAKLKNLVFDPGNIGLLNVNFNFLTEEVSETNYSFHVIQKDVGETDILGGETYLVERDPRDLFMANAGGDENIDEEESITLNANSINEPATYNWYDLDGNLIYTGPNLTVSPEITKKYKLEIIANADGYKDYDEVEVKVNLVYLESLVPNPASTSVTISYDLHGANSAYLTITNTASAASNNYILDVQQPQRVIDISSYSTGAYVASLFCDGEVRASKNLLIE